MSDGVVSPLAAWNSFYVMVGSSAAALTGLQFVVIALGAESRALGGQNEIRAFGTPTIVHFCAVLLISAIVTAPWPSPLYAGVALGACGAAGLAYGVMTLRAALRATAYEPVPEDWLWHCAFPAAAYATVLIAATRSGSHPGPALFAIGAAALLLLFIAIHNAWDAVTYMTLNHRHKSDSQEKV